MNAYADKTQENKRQSVSNSESQTKSSGESDSQFVDNRPEAVAQKKLHEMANNSSRVSQMKSFQEMSKSSAQDKQWNFDDSLMVESNVGEASTNDSPIQGAWTFNMNNAPGTAGIPRSAMLHFYAWRRAIRDNDVAPDVAADWDAHFEAVGDHYTIRLNQKHRVHFNIDWDSQTVTLLQVGQHDL